jgi:catechol 2,3-dioxygenase-like lactoylglutathione lyase family enzyme
MRRAPRRLARLVSLVWLQALALAASAAARSAPVRAVGAVGMTVADMDRSVRFYRDVLDFEPVADTELSGEAWEHLRGVVALRARVVRLRLGDETVELTQYVAPRGRPVPADARSDDRWFQHVAIIVRDMDAAYARLRAAGVTHVSTAPQRLPDWNPAAGGIEAFYFKDPDGHALEVLRFPPGKGDPRWQRPSERLFLGIDHTAIVVDDTDASLAFYRDRLGLRVAGTSDNHGPEQERLSGVAGAHLRITALRAAAGPGIELLEYLAPPAGRPYPADSRANDLWHWQTRLVVTDVAAAAAAPATLVSPGAIALPRDVLGVTKGVLVRDPDGHALELVEP